MLYFSFYPSVMVLSKWSVSVVHMRGRGERLYLLLCVATTVASHGWHCMACLPHRSSSLDVWWCAKCADTAPVGSVSLHKMAGQLRGNRRRLRAIALLQARPHATVHLHPLERSQPLGQHLAIERMLKPVAAVPPSCRAPPGQGRETAPRLPGAPTANGAAWLVATACTRTPYYEHEAPLTCLCAAYLPTWH